MNSVLELTNAVTETALCDQGPSISQANISTRLGPSRDIPLLRRLLALHNEVRQRLAQACAVERRAPEPYGFDFDTAADLYTVMVALHRWYFRASCVGIENLVPGPLILIANHGSHALSWDGANILSACLLAADPPRLIRPMADHRLMELPVIGWAARRIGAVDGQRSLCIDLLRSGATVLTFPEGTRALTKPFWRRYELSRFTQGFMHVALTTGAPIVPVATIGSEEEAPLLFNAERLARLLRTPVAPITPTLLVPFPVRYFLHFGSPMYFRDLKTASEISGAVETVRSSLGALLRKGLRERRARRANSKLWPKIPHLRRSLVK